MRVEITDGEIRAYQDLAQAIIKTAADDYRLERKKKKYAITKEGRDRAAAEMRQIIKFFRSEYFSNLSSVDPEIIIE